MNDREKEQIEELLRNYRSLKANIRIEITRKCPEYSLPAIDYEKVSTGETNVIYSDVENYVVRKIGIEENLKKKIKVRDMIKAAYDSLSIEQKRIVEHLYFDNKSLKQVAGRVGWSESTVRRRREEILGTLKGVGILQAWPMWEEISKMNTI